MLSAAPAEGQPAPASSIPHGSASISGRLIDAHTKQPIIGCMVSLNQLYVTPSRNAATTTNGDGDYAFTDIADAEYHVNAWCKSHLRSCYRSAGTSPPRCDTVAVVVDQRKTVDLTLVPGARARGRVVDSRGRPVSGATVRLGTPVSDIPPVMHSPTETRRDGSFELINLPAGEWRLEVEVPADADSQRPPIVFFPGVLAASEAGSIELAAGETLDNIVVVAPRMSDHILTVRIVTAEQNLSHLDVSLVRPEPLNSRRVTIDASGTGTISGVTPGRYFLTARGWTGERAWTAADVVEFAGDTHEVLLYLQPAARLRGRIVAEKGAAPSMEGVRVGATWAYDGVAINPLAYDETPVAPDGTFLLDGLFGSCHLQLLGFDPAFEIQSISQGRSNVTAAGVALTAGAESNVVMVVRRR